MVRENHPNVQFDLKINYWQTPEAVHLPLTPAEIKHLAWGLLNSDGPQNRAVDDPLHLGTLLQVPLGEPQGSLIFLNWHAVLQQELP